MSKRSREKHARPQFEPTETEVPEQDDVCTECFFFPKKPNRDVCEECASMEQPT